MEKVNDQVLAIVADIDTATNGVAAKLDRAVAELEQGTVSQGALNLLRQSSARLKSLAADPANPVPVEPANPVTGGDVTGGDVPTTGDVTAPVESGEETTEETGTTEEGSIEETQTQATRRGSKR